MYRPILGAAGIWLFAACWAASAASAEIYRWVDEKGEMHIVSELHQVPPQYREAAIADTKRGRGTLNIIEGPGAEPPPPAMIAAPENPETPEPAAASTPQPGEPAEASDDFDDFDDYGADSLERAMARERRRRVVPAGNGEAPRAEANATPAEEPAEEPRE
jgi:type IV secretory pathway VirB10-like protein